MIPSDLLELEMELYSAPESPTNALTATLELIASLTNGKPCSDCQVANRVAREAVRKVGEEASK